MAAALRKTCGSPANIAAGGGSGHVSSKTISLFPECSKLPETKVKVQEVSLSSSFPSRLPWRKTRTGVNLKECVLCEEKKKRRTEQRRASKDFKGSVGGAACQSQALSAKLWLRECPASLHLTSDDPPQPFSLSDSRRSAFRL